LIDQFGSTALIDLIAVVFSFLFLFLFSLSKLAQVNPSIQPFKSYPPSPFSHPE